MIRANLKSRVLFQDEGLDQRDVDLGGQESWDQIRDAVASVQSSSKLVHLRHPSKHVWVQKVHLFLPNESQPKGQAKQSFPALCRSCVLWVGKFYISCTFFEFPTFSCFFFKSPNYGSMSQAHFPDFAKASWYFGQLRIYDLNQPCPSCISLNGFCV